MNEFILNSVRQLVTDGHFGGLTPDVTLYGVPLLGALDDTMDNPDKIVWRADGFSEQQSEWGGRMCRAVEKARSAELDQAAALALPQYFMQTNLIDADTSDEAAFVIRMNAGVLHMKRGWAFGGSNIRGVIKPQKYSAPAFVRGTKTPDWGLLPPYMTDAAPRGSVGGDWIGNHRIALGNDKNDSWTSEQLGEWAKGWLERHKAGTLGHEVL